MHILQVLVTFVNISFGSSQCDNVALLALIREGNLHLVELFSDLADVLSPGPDDGAMETLVNNDIAGLLVFLKICTKYGCALK